MNKYMTLILVPWLACNAAIAQDATYYSLHPVELEQALAHCPGAHPRGVSCEQLNVCAIRANELASELHYSPQMFGQKILALQEQLASLEAELKQDSQAQTLRASVDEHSMQLRERLAIVKWLESPRG